MENNRKIAGIIRSFVSNLVIKNILNSNIDIAIQKNIKNSILYINVSIVMMTHFLCLACMLILKFRP